MTNDKLPSAKHASVMSAEQAKKQTFDVGIITLINKAINKGLHSTVIERRLLPSERKILEDKGYTLVTDGDIEYKGRYPIYSYTIIKWDLGEEKDS